MFGAAASRMSWALAAVAAPGNRTASLGAIQSFGGYLGGALAATVTGFILQEASCRRCWRVRRSGWYRHLPILLSFARNRLQSPSLTPSLACGR
jgi:MFS family permease